MVMCVVILILVLILMVLLVFIIDKWYNESNDINDNVKHEILLMKWNEILILVMTMKSINISNESNMKILMTIVILMIM